GGKQLYKNLWRVRPTSPQRCSGGDGRSGHLSRPSSPVRNVCRRSRWGYKNRRRRSGKQRFLPTRRSKKLRLGGRRRSRNSAHKTDRSSYVGRFSSIKLSDTCVAYKRVAKYA